ncbi:MAG TPA: thioredoxin family protein, partial [Candidatus Obscuribacter sp.]|nr:thioredoxin family protein [Candidatus Obscuribacter sp.]
ELITMAQNTMSRVDSAPEQEHKSGYQVLENGKVLAPCEGGVCKPPMDENKFMKDVLVTPENQEAWKQWRQSHPNGSSELFHPVEATGGKMTAGDKAKFPGINLFDSERFDVPEAVLKAKETGKAGEKVVEPGNIKPQEGVKPSTEQYPSLDEIKRSSLLNLRRNSTIQCHDSGQNQKPELDFRSLDSLFKQKPGKDLNSLESLLKQDGAPKPPKPGEEQRLDKNSAQYKELEQFLKGLENQGKKDSPKNQPAENSQTPPADKAVDKPADQPAENSQTPPADKSVDKPADQPAENSQTPPADKSVDNSVDKQAEKKADLPKLEEKPLSPFQQAIKDSGAYTLDNLQPAMNAAAKDKAGVAFMIVGENSPGSKELLAKLPELQKQHPDLKFVVVNKDEIDKKVNENPKDQEAQSWKGWIDHNLRDCSGKPIDYTFTSVQTLKADAAGKPMPDKVTSTHWGADIEAGLADQSRYAAAGTARNADKFKLAMSADDTANAVKALEALKPQGEAAANNPAENKVRQEQFLKSIKQADSMDPELLAKRKEEVQAQLEEAKREQKKLDYESSPSDKPADTSKLDKLNLQLQQVETLEKAPGQLRAEMGFEMLNQASNEKNPARQEAMKALAGELLRNSIKADPELANNEDFNCRLFAQGIDAAKLAEQAKSSSQVLNATQLAGALERAATAGVINDSNVKPVSHDQPKPVKNETDLNKQVPQEIEKVGPEKKLEAPAKTVYDGAGYKDALAEAQRRGLPVVFKVGAEWCPPCQNFERNMAGNLENTYKDKAIVVKVDSDRNPDIARALGANRLPTSGVGYEDESGRLRIQNSFVGFSGNQDWMRRIQSGMTSAQTNINRMPR